MNIKHLKQPYVLVLIGPPLSGKDTVLKQMDLSNTVVISRDQILMDIYGSENYDEAFKNVNQKEVDVELQRQLREASENKRNTIINMTNMTSKRRSHNLSFFGDEYTKIAVIFPILEWDEYRKRNEKRQAEENKSIPEHVLRNMIGSYQPIRESEGFDKVISLEN
jgi:predicted kinase